MAGIQLFDIGGSFREGMERGQKRAALRDFFQPAAGGDRNALARLAQVDPQSAQNAQTLATGTQKSAYDRIGKLAGVYAQTQDPAVWRELRQGLAEARFPAEMPWEIATDEDRAGSLKFATSIAQQFGGVGQSAGLQEFSALTSGLSAEDQMRARRIKLGLDARSVGAARKAVTIKLRNGQEVPGEFDPELGYSVWDSSQNMMVPLGRGDISGVRDNSGGAGGAPQPAAPTQSDMEGDISLANSMIAAGIPEAQVEAFLRNRGQRAEQPGAVAPSGIQSMVGSQTPGEQSYVQETGKTQAQLDAGDAVTRMEVERAAAKARAEAAAKAQAEVDAKSATRTRDADQTLALLEEAERILPQATGSRAGSVRDSLAGMAGIATEGAKASDSLKIIAAELVAKVPRFEGPQSNIDVQFYREAAGDLANDQLPVERRMAALQTIRRLRQKYASQQPARRAYTQQEALQKLQEARRAIGSGADREAVRQRLRDLGLNNIAERL